MVRNTALILILLLIPGLSYAQTAGEYLILQDIGRYKLTKGIEIRGRILGGEPAVARIGDEGQGYYTSYGTRYVGGAGYVVPTVEVRVYDSTQWMLHEMERDLKEYQGSVATKTNTSAITKSIDNNPVIKMRSGGGIYRWVSNNKAILVSYHDLQLQYPVPMEVISAYLQKYPSTLPTTYQIRHPDREKEFIREEFDRLLWVADRWVSLVQEADPNRAEKLKQAADNLLDFARYRQAYFKPLFGDPMEADIDLLEMAHMGPNLETIVRTKLAEYKEWWAGHKTDKINFP